MTFTRFSREMFELLSTTKITTAVGPDSLSSAFLRYGAAALSNVLTSVINILFCLLSLTA